jgi:hypothetical protein
MTDTAPDRAVRAFDAHEAFDRDGEWFVVSTTTFDGRVTAEATDEWALGYTLEVRAPMLSTVTEDDVGPAVEAGWFDTYERRLEDAPKAVRHDLELDEQRVFEEAGDAVAVFGFEWGNADQVPDIAKAVAEYTEGTYVEGVVPGYQYGSPVSELLSQARHDGEGSSGPMPM